MRLGSALSTAIFILVLLGQGIPAGYDLHGPSQRDSSTSLPLAAVSGTQNTIVILVRFSDKINSTNPPMISDTISSMNTYYSEDSYGTVSFLADIYPLSSSLWYLMPRTMGYYGTDSTSSNTELVRDALQAAYDAAVDLTRYKYAIVVHAGDDEATTHSTGDIHSYTIPGYVFTPTLLTRIPISTSVVAETDPMGVYAHESGHLLGLPDLYDTTGNIDPTNNFVGYWDLMALGEWNPNTGNPLVRPGTYPSHMSAWSKIELGFIAASRIATFQSGQSGNVTVENLEMPTTGIQAVKLPLTFNPDGSMTYYLVEMRAKQGTYDYYLPFPATYPNAGLLVYKIDESIPDGTGKVRLIDAHPGGNLNDAAFGPCISPCVSNNTFSDLQNYVKIIVTGTNSSAFSVSVDRTDSPPFLLQVNTPSEGVLVSIDGVNKTTDASGQLRITVRFGPHTVFVEARIPVSVGSTTVQFGLTNTFAGWDDGEVSNPRGVSVVGDTALTAVYRITIEPSFAVVALAILVILIAVVAGSIHRRGRQSTPPVENLPRESPRPTPTGPEARSLPGDDRLPGQTIDKDQQADSSHR